MPDTLTSGDIASAAAEQSSTATASPAAHSTDQPTAATPGDTGTAVQTETTSRDGWIPPDRHKDILEKHRRDSERAKREYEREMERLSWARQYDPIKVARALELAEQHERQRQSSTAPQPDLRTEDGKTLYSAEQAAALARHEVSRAVERLEAKWTERLGPIENWHRQGQVNAGIESQIQTASQWPGFGDHVDAIATAIAEANDRGELLSLHEAYIRVVVPQLVQSENDRLAAAKKAVLDEINKNSAATRDQIDPARRPPARSKPDSEKSLTEMIEEEFAARQAR